MVLTFITFQYIIIGQVDTASYILEQFIGYYACGGAWLDQHSSNLGYNRNRIIRPETGT